jgi:hypothetical protein
MNATIEHFKDHYRVVREDGTTTEVDTYEEAKEEIEEREKEES